MKIKGSTNIVGLIGHPVEHSFSPPMHNAAFDALNMDYAYVAFDVNPNDLKTAIEGAQSLNIKGFNVTIPHKVDVMQYLDELDEVARLIGAVISGLKVNSRSDLSLKLYNWFTISSPDFVVNKLNSSNKGVLIS